MDPQDLLFTNTFVNENVINKKELQESSKNYFRFKKYVENNLNETNDYINDDSKESDPFNINKTLQEPWPTNLKKNHYPLFDEYQRDISKSRYHKEIVSRISIESKNRDTSKYLYPNNFFIPFNKVYTNIREIKINDICMPNFFPPVTNYNNNITWQYATSAILQNFGIDDNIIPVPNNSNTINYSTVNPFSVYKTTDTSFQIAYQINIPEGYYNTKQLENAIKRESSEIVHGSTIQNINFLDRNRGDPINNNIYPWKFPFEQPYYSTSSSVPPNPYNPGKNTPTLLKCTINPIDSTVFFVNRMEELEIVALQTFETFNITNSTQAQMDIFHPFIVGGSVTIDPKYIYLTVNIGTTTSLQWFDLVYSGVQKANPFPLVITDLKGSIGNINCDLLNYTEFWDELIYTSNGYTTNELHSISTYKYFDKFAIEDKYGNVHTYLRFQLKLSSGKLNGKKEKPNGCYGINPKKNQTIIFNESLSCAFCSGQTSPTAASPPTTHFGVIYNNNAYEVPTIGRAILFEFLFDSFVENDCTRTFLGSETDSINVKKKSLLNLLCWPIPKNTYNIFVIAEKPQFAFVHSNITGYQIQKDIYTTDNIPIPYNYRVPVNKLSLQLFNDGFYYFTSSDFIYLKLIPAGSAVIAENLQVAQDNSNAQYNQNYVNDAYLKGLIGSDYPDTTEQAQTKEIQQIPKNYENIYAKILLSNIPNNTEKIILESNQVEFYQKPLDNVSGVYIQILDSDMKQYFLGRNFSFTIEIKEIRDLLKETLIDTKRDNVITTGYTRFS